MQQIEFRLVCYVWNIWVAAGDIIENQRWAPYAESPWLCGYLHRKPSFCSARLKWDLPPCHLHHDYGMLSMLPWVGRHLRLCWCHYTCGNLLLDCCPCSTWRRQILLAVLLPLCHQQERCPKRSEGYNSLLALGSRSFLPGLALRVCGR